MRCAMIDGGVVTTIILADECPAGAVAVEGGLKAGVGWSWDGAQFTPPAVAVEPPGAADVLEESMRRKRALVGAADDQRLRDIIDAGTREGLELRQERDRRPWTPAEDARAAQLTAFQAALAAIDTAAAEISLLDPIPDDYADDSRWTLPPAVQEVPPLLVLIESAGLQPRAPSVAGLSPLEAERALAAADVRLAAAARLTLLQGADPTRYAITDVSMELAYEAKTGNTFATEQIGKLAAVTGRSVLDEADAIIADRQAFRSQVMDIEKERLSGLTAIGAAVDTAEIAAARSAAIEAIYYLQWGA